jgi:membrane-associated phospholipid phosphatase
MPSGHAQMTAFALTVAYLFTNQYLYQSIFLFFVTILQRFVYNNHTLLQLCVGSILGITIGGIFYKILKPLTKYVSCSS